MPSQSSSTPLHLSPGGMHEPQAQLAEQVRVPVDPHVVAQFPLDPAGHVNPSSTIASQSSSAPLQVSAGGVQLPHVQLAPHVRVPVEPHVAVQLPVVPLTHCNVSSMIVSQSSSTPLHASGGGAHEPQVHVVLLHVRLPVVPQPVVQLPLEPPTHAKPSSGVPSQSSSEPLQVSGGGLHAPQAQLDEHAREPVVPQLDVQLPVEPAAHVKPSSTVPSQSSSVPVQASVGGVHEPQAHEAPHSLLPVEPQPVVHDCVLPRQHVKPSSQSVSQSSSAPLHVSEGGLHVPHAQLDEHVRAPIVPQLDVQLPVAPTAHVKPSSMNVLQSSSTPLHTSAGGLHTPHPQPALHVCEPVVPHDDAQLRVAPTAQRKPSSTRVSQSSSVPLHSSAGGAHVPHAQLAPHTREPVESQLVVHDPVAPARHVNPSSTSESQSSSTPLHVSAGLLQLPQAQLEPHVREPIEPQAVRQLPMLPRQQVKASSHAPLQSSSTPLHVSGGGEQMPQEQTELHTRDPVVPQLVVQLPVVPRQHANPSSHVVSQSSSTALQSSGAPGYVDATASSQSSAGTPPEAGHASSPRPSRSRSRVEFAHIPGVAPRHASSVHASPSSQVGAVPGRQPSTASQVSLPLQKFPSAQ
jgi:hypothetical protein